MPGQRRLAGDVRDAGSVQGEEHQGGAGGAVAPGVGDLVLVVEVAGDVARDDETLPTRVAERHQMFRTAAGRGCEVRAVELRTGERQRGGDTRQAVREIGHLGAGRVGAEARWHPAPVGAGRQVLRLWP